MFRKKRIIIHLVQVGLLACSHSAFAGEDYKTQKSEPASFVEGCWTVVVLPDTQNYVKSLQNLTILDSMMDWIAENRDVRNIGMVIHVGDMTNGNSDHQWERVRSSYRKIDNLIPYVVCVGNHDEKRPKKPSKINEYFKIDDNPLNKEIFGGSYEKGKLENAYYTLTQNGQAYLFLALEYATREAVIQWADKVIKAHPDHRVFITVHKYMNEEVRLTSPDGLPDPLKDSHSGYDEAGIFKNLAEINPNVEFITCGHVGAVKKGSEGRGPAGYEGVLVYDPDIATGHRSDSRPDGVTIHQMLFNAQWISNGGDGWMLLLEFHPDNNSVKAKTYSPHLNLWRTGPEFEYTLNRN